MSSKLLLRGKRSKTDVIDEGKFLGGDRCLCESGVCKISFF